MSDPQIELTVHVGGPLPLQMRCDPDQADDWRDVLTRLGLEVSYQREVKLPLKRIDNVGAILYGECFDHPED